MARKGGLPPQELTICYEREFAALSEREPPDCVTLSCSAGAFQLNHLLRRL
jgi:hypothetical protein